MIKKYEEAAEADFDGTVIDIETIGEFERQYSDDDSRQYKDMKIVIFGFISRHSLKILWAEGEESIDELEEEIRKIIDGMERPFYAFNSRFERGVLFNHLGLKINFDRELQRGRENKVDVVRALGIPNYDDPFPHRKGGLQCSDVWKAGEFDKAKAHNRACLLKERDILLKRGFRESDELRFVME